MQKIYVLGVLVFLSLSSSSCTTDEVSENPKSEFVADGDTGGQNSALTPPPPPKKP